MWMTEMFPCPFVECESLIGKKNQISCSIAYLAKKRHCKLLPIFYLYTVQQSHQLFLLSTPRACRDTYLRIRATVPDFQKKSFTGKRTKHSIHAYQVCSTNYYYAKKSWIIWSSIVKRWLQTCKTLLNKHVKHSFPQHFSNASCAVLGNPWPYFS